MTNKEIESRYGLIGDELDLKENVSLIINEDGKILKVRYDNPKKNIEIGTDKHNLLMMPGFINSHTHIVDSFAKEMGFNKDLMEVVAPPNGLKHKLLKNTSREIKSIGIKNAISEMLTNGITFFVDFRERDIEGIQFLKDSLKGLPLNYIILGRFTDAKEIEEIFKEGDGIGLSSYNDLSIYIKERLKYFKNIFKKPIACHDAEVERDKALFEEIINDDLIDIIVHGTHYTKEDLELIKNKKISLILCPRSNGYFGVGFPPITEIIRLQIPISLGTDNIMINNTDLFEELRYTYRILRVLGRNDENVKLDSKELLKMITINAARNFNLEKNRGSISQGKVADLLLIDLNDPNFYSFKVDSNNIFPLIVQRAKSENIKRVYIRGELVFERS
ncbi:MAG: amidohydrolase family protein [Promethearchaeota archaeon]